MSQQLYEAALETTVFMDHVGTADGFGKGKGESVTLTRIANLSEPTTAVLDENQRIPEDDFALSTGSITVVELGRAIPITSLAKDLSEFNLDNPVQKLLRNQMSLVLDTNAAAAFKDTPIKYVPTGLASATITTNGIAGATASENMNMYHVEEIRDYMFDTLAVPKIGGPNGDYMGIFRTKGLRGIKRDPSFEEWHKYTDPQKKANSEVGRTEQIRFIETNHANAMPVAGSGSCLGTGVVFGEDAVVMAEAQTPEIRVAMPQDFGRAQAAAWYGVLAFGAPYDTSANQGECRTLHVTSL
jgi:N4-gp56 family major capsid protein